MINSEEMKKFYCGKKVFITGNTGFKGTWITLMLQHMGACVGGICTSYYRYIILSQYKYACRNAGRSRYCRYKKGYVFDRSI